MPFSKEMILGASGNQGAAGFYEHQIEQSLFITGGGTHGLNRTLGTPTNDKKLTLSAWIKRAEIGNTNLQEIYKSFGLYTIEGIPRIFLVSKIGIVLNSDTNDHWRDSRNIPVTEFVKYLQSYSSEL